MRIEQGYYGDFKVMDEMPFATSDIVKALFRISHIYNVNAFKWPVTIDFNEKTEYWEVWFTRPVSDEEYVKRMDRLNVE